MPSSSISSRRRRMTSRLKFIRKRTSSGERFQFSVEKAYRERFLTPISRQPLSTSSTTPSPTLWPSVRGRPRSLAQRPLPSMTIATCFGHQLAGDLRRPRAGRVRLGGLVLAAVTAPSIPRTCHVLLVSLAALLLDVSQRAQPALQMPLQIRGRPARCPPGQCRGSHASAVSQSPVSSAPSSARASGEGTTLPGTRQSPHTTPPAATEKNRFGPGMPHFAQSSKLGA